jgi:hypothetical protein
MDPFLRSRDVLRCFYVPSYLDQSPTQSREFSFLSSRTPDHDPSSFESCPDVSLEEPRVPDDLYSSPLFCVPEQTSRHIPEHPFEPIYLPPLFPIDFISFRPPRTLLSDQKTEVGTEVINSTILHMMQTARPPKKTERSL